MYPYQSTYPQFQPNFQQQINPGMAQNALPAQQVIQANGKASIDALRMAPNSSVLIMDSTAPIVWLCTSDGLGNVTANAYDIVPHVEKPPVDMGALEQRIANIEGIIARWEGNNDKSNGGGIKSVQSGGDASEHSTNKTDV